MVLLYEYEIKIKVENLEKIRKKLQEMNANFLGVIEELDIYFQHPCRDFRRTDEALRVRIYNDKLELTYKGPKISDEIKAREEINIELRHEDLQKIVELL
ncbi:MAG: class IV adenylate cyclase, partial [Thermoprotei archaeon]